MILYDNKPYKLRSACLVTDLFCCFRRAISRTFSLSRYRSVIIGGRLSCSIIRVGVAVLPTSRST